MSPTLILAGERIDPMDNNFMEHAFDQAFSGMRANHGGPFGCVIVKDGKVVGTGHNSVTSTNDPTAHAEVMAIRDACKTLNTFDLTGTELYATCEPCPMCLSAIYWARIGNVYYAATRNDAAGIGFDDDLIYRELEKPNDLKLLRLIKVHDHRAETLFNEWATKPDKLAY